ncbi:MULTISPECIES: kynureninase [Mycolicibacter]|uniref:Kynureninase n=2 Tax=Mycolicibacter TaxID=1073531 RepID=A0ABU5XL34_9MYCO|nr:MULTISPECIES: kynureninase [unclassified Mycolicibacter]MEB3022995.1 kynureninase [Mycolicibacter sp. MYC098]MEB3033505.1 kynureninase [Mycolicibacter sp. MYC340]
MPGREAYAANRLTRNDFRGLDADDPLNGARGEFDLPDETIYLDGNSLGAMPRTAADRLAGIARNWRRDLNRGWSEHGWLDAPLLLGDKIAQLIGADAGEVAAGDSTSVNLFKLLAAALRLRPGRSTILTEDPNFPSDLYIARAVERMVGGEVHVKSVPRDDLTNAIDDDTAVLMLTQADFRTGYLHDMAALSRIAGERGALSLWDLSHTAGVYPVNLNSCGADLAVGCGYKYLNGGPGAPAYLFVARRHHDTLEQPLAGWLGHEKPFLFETQYRPAAGVARTICGTPSVFGLATLEAGVDIQLKHDIDEIRRKSTALTRLFMRLIDQECAADGFGIITPILDEHRGSQVSLAHPDAEQLIAGLADHGVIGDFRAPNILRFGFAPLYVRYTDVWEAVARLKEATRG